MSILSNFFYDPRKLFIGGFLGSIALMSLGVMDYRFLPFHYFILLILMITQLPLLFLGTINTKTKIEVPNWVGWAFLLFSILLVGINIKLNGLPFLIGKILEGSPLNQQLGEHYHKKIRLTAILWPLLTILIPMSLLVKGKLIKYLLLFWAILASGMIQIKSPFIFGFIYFLIFFQITGRKLKVLHLFLLIFFICLLFVAINATRTSDEFSEVAIVMGLAKSYQTLSPIIWLPLSYIAGPIANGFQIMGGGIINLYLYPYFLTLPNVIIKESERQFLSINTLKTLPWPDTNNAISAVGSFSHMFGVVGMVLFIFLLSLLLYYLIKNHFFGNLLLFAFFLVSIKNVALFPIGNYFIDPSFVGELIFLFIFLSFAKIKIFGTSHSP